MFFPRFEIFDSESLNTMAPAGCCSGLLLMTILLRSLLFSAKTLRELSTLLFTCDYNLCTLISSEKIPQWSSGKSDHHIVINSDHYHQEIHTSPRVGHPVEACLLLFDLRSSSLQVSYQCVKILLFINIDKENGKRFTHFCDYYRRRNVCIVARKHSTGVLDVLKSDCF